MTSMFRTTLAAALLTGAALSPALAQGIVKPVIHSDTADVQAATSARPLSSDQQVGLTNDNAQAGVSDIGDNAAPNIQANHGNTQIAMNTTTSDAAISSDPSPTERKGTHLTKAQERKANRAEARTTKELNQQAAAMAAPANS